MKVSIYVLSLLLVSLAWPQGRPTVTVDTGNCALSATCNGGIGFTSPDTGDGVGFQYPKYAPSCLYHGSFAVANSESTVHDHFYGVPATNLHCDWVARDTFVDIIPPWFGAHELYRGSMVDTTRPTPAQGFLVTHWCGGRGPPLTSYDDFVIVRYDVKNNSPSQIDSIYAGVFVDFDLGTSPTTNWCRVDTARRLVWMSPTSTSFNPSVGVKLLEPDSAASLLYFDPRQLLPPPPFNDTAKYRVLRGTITPPPPRPYDYIICVSAAPFDLAPGRWVRTAFAIIGATDSAALKRHADSAQAWYDRDWRTSIEEARSQKLEARRGLEISPNPFRRKAVIRYTIQDTRCPIEEKRRSKRDVGLVIYDISGKAVRDFDVSSHVPRPSHFIMWDGTDNSAKPLPAGVYFVQLETAENNYTKKVLLLR